jgi:hypothetical protein
VFVTRKIRTEAEFNAAKTLIASGLSIHGAARRLGIPYATVRYWTSLSVPPHTASKARPWTGPPSPRAYCYLLGLYLGDGCIGLARRSLQLSLTLDARYPCIVEEAARSLTLTVPSIRIGRTAVPGAVRLYASYRWWPEVFPQHGTGRKHRRRIVLAEWQEELTCRYPRDLLRGLIHSDGARCVNRFTTKLPSGRIADYSYVRYFFTNYSADIRRIFCQHCDLIGIHWTQSSFKNISIAHRDSVAILERFVGPKR